MIAWEDFLAKLHGVVRLGEYKIKALCPAHDDHDPTLSVGRGVDGRILLHCFVGCSYEAICSAAHVKPSDLRPPRKRGRPPRQQRGEPIAEVAYDYLDESGELLYQVVRRDYADRPKEFAQRRPDGHGGWYWNLTEDTRRLLYRLPQLMGQVEVLIGEGEKVVDHLAALGFAATTASGGGKTWATAAAPELVEQLKLGGCRRAMILPDHDQTGRAMTTDAARLLMAAGIVVAVIMLDGLEEHGDVVDWLEAGHTAEELRAIITASSSLTEAPPATGAAAPGLEEYAIRDGRIVHIRHTQDGPVADVLAHFRAEIVEELLLDDGEETSREFLIEGRAADGTLFPQVRVPAGKFPGLAWVTEHWGAAAQVRAGQLRRDHLRAAILALSRPRQRRVRIHTGFVNDEGTEDHPGPGWLYLTAAGAVGSTEYEVDLGTRLARYALPRYPTRERDGIAASLSTWGLAPLSVTVPMWAGTFRAPLAVAHPCDFSLWLVGATGAQKSTLAALYQSHYGDFPDKTTLPVHWSWTAARIESALFKIKDALVVVDDYAPDKVDPRELVGKAQRVIRSQGNLSARGRLRADLGERPDRPPRGLLCSTGEAFPPGESIAARAMLMHLEPGRVAMPALTALQRPEVLELLREGFAGYVLWLGRGLGNGLAERVREQFAEARTAATVGGQHRRVPEIVAHLWLGIRYGLDYAVVVGALTEKEADRRRDDAWGAFLALADAQGKLVEARQPTRMFLEVLSTLLAQRQVRLLRREQAPEDVTPTPAEILGWYDEAHLYLMLRAAIRVLGRYCRDIGEAFPIPEDRLAQLLVDEKLAEPGSDQITGKVLLGGKQRRVLKIDLKNSAKVLGAPIAIPETFEKVETPGRSPF